jgi:hypothetical protein
MWLVTHLHTCGQSEWWPTNQACHPERLIPARSNPGILTSLRILILSDIEANVWALDTVVLPAARSLALEAFATCIFTIYGNQERELYDAGAQNGSEDHILADGIQDIVFRTFSPHAGHAGIERTFCG